MRKAPQLITGMALALVMFTSASKAQDLNAEQMARWAEFMATGSEHSMLAKREGKWNLTIRMWTSPDANEMKSSAEANARMIMGGRYLQEQMRGSFQGLPFEGVSVTGFDNLQKKYVSVWFDSMGTGITRSVGTYDEDRQIVEFETESSNPLSGEVERGRAVERMESEDKWVVEMFGPGPDGREYRMMEIIYERAEQ